MPVCHVSGSSNPAAYSFDARSITCAACKSLREKIYTCACDQQHSSMILKPSNGVCVYMYMSVCMHVINSIAACF